MNSEPARPPGQAAPDRDPPAPRPPRRRGILRRIAHHAVLAVAFLVVGVLVLAGVAVALLARGPIDLGFLTPQLQAALDAQVESTRLRLGGTVLAWDGERRAVEVRAVDVTIADRAGQPLARVPRMAVHLSVAGLLKGVIAPQAVDVTGASLTLTAPGEGAAVPSVNRIDAGQLGAFLNALLRDPPNAAGDNTAAAYLTEVTLRDAAVVFIGPDGAPALSAAGLDVTLTRGADAVRGDLAGRVTAAGVSAPVSAAVERDTATGDIIATAELAETPPELLLAIVAQVLPATPLPDQLTEPLPRLSGVVTARLDADFTVTAVALDLTAPVAASLALAPNANGRDLTAVLRDADLTALAAAMAPLAPLARIQAPVDADIAVALDAAWRPTALDARIQAGAGVIDLPELYPDAPVAVSGVQADIAAADFIDLLPADISVERLAIDLGAGRSAVVTGAATRDGDAYAVRVEAEATGVPVDDLATLWPPTIGVNPRQWVTRNLTGGVVPRATMRLSATVPAASPRDLADVAVAGEIDFAGVSTHYLRPMPPVLDTVGQARYTADEFVIDVTGGVRGALTVEAAQVRITGLGVGEEVVDIDLTVAGPAADALTLLDSEPLGYATALGLDPGTVGGSQRTNVVFHIPLRRNLTLDDIEVAAAASLSGIAVADGPFGQPIGGGELSLEVDKDRLVAWGDIALGGVPLTGSWMENFADDSTFTTQYEITGVLSAGQLGGLGLDFAQALDGDIGVGVTYAILADGGAVGAADLELQAAVIEVPSLGLEKPAGMPARAEVQFVVEQGLLSDVPDFRVLADEFTIAGAVQFTPDATGTPVVSRLQLSQLAFAGNDLNGVIDVPVDDPSAPLDIRIGGERLDARPFMAGDEDTTSAAETGEPSDAGPFRVTILREDPIAEVVLTDGLVVRDFWGQLRSDGDTVRDAVLHSRLTDTGVFDVVVEDAGSARAFDVTSSDFGALLALMGVSDSVRGGAVRIDGVIDDDVPGTSIRGRGVATDFEMVDAPLLGKLLTLPSLVGIANTLQGKGIAFERAEVPFTLSDDLIAFEEGRIRGSQLGILVEGTIDRRADTMDIQGEVAPATIINSMLNNVPIVGDVLTGGGEGVFAATYRINGPVASPTVSVNPISVLAPGFIRRIVGGFSDEEAVVEEDDPYPDPDSDVQ